MCKDLVIYGAWYFSDVVAELAVEQGWNVVGRIDPQPPTHINALDHFPDGSVSFVAIGDNMLRRHVTEQLEARSRNIISLIHPTATISPSSVIGAGSYISENAVIRTKSLIGRGVTVNAGAVIGHHVNIGDFVVLGSNTAVASRGTVGSGTMLGVGACMRPTCMVGENCTIGAGSVIVSDIPAESVAAGNPIHLIKPRASGERERQSNWESNQVW